MPAGNGGRLFLCVSRQRGWETGLLPPEVWNPVSLVDTLFLTAGPKQDRSAAEGIRCVMLPDSGPAGDGGRRTRPALPTGTLRKERI